MTSVETTHYCLGSVMGPHPFPRIVRDFQSVIGRETRGQCLGAAGPAAGRGRGLRGRREQRRGDVLSVHRRPRRGAGGRRGRRPLRRPGDHAATLCFGRPGILHGSFSYVLQDDDGQTCARAFHLGRPGLPGRGTGAQLLERVGPGQLHQRHRRRGAGGLRRAGPQRGHPPGPGKCPRRGQGHGDGRRAPARRGDRGLPLRPRRQGRGRGRAAARRGDLHRMSAIDDLFARLRKAGAARPSCPLSPPAIRTWISPAAVLRELVGRGSPLCEVGIPYSDPIADGPVIQASYTRALEHQTPPGRHPRHARPARRPSCRRPIVTMVSYAIVYRQGLEAYVAEAQAAGVAGAIVPDLPVEESGPLAKLCRRARFQPDPTGHAHHAPRAGPADRRADHRLHLLRLGDRHHRRAPGAAAGAGRERGLAARQHAAADLHRLRHQPARARAHAGPRGRRADRRLGHRPPHRRGRPQAACGGARRTSANTRPSCWRPWRRSRLGRGAGGAEGDRSMFSVNQWLANATPLGRKMDQSPLIYSFFSSRSPRTSSAVFFSAAHCALSFRQAFL